MKYHKKLIIIILYFIFILYTAPVMAEGSYNEVAKLELPSFCTGISEVYVGNGFAFLKGNDDIYIINISNPESPKFYGNISDYLPELKGYYSPFSMAVSENRIYVSMGSIYVFQISEGRISLAGQIKGSFKGISTNGNIVCAMSGSTREEFRIGLIDFTDPENPENISGIPSTYEGNHAGGNILFSGNDLYISYIGGSGTEIVRYDIKDPTKPREVSKYYIEGMPASPICSLSVSGDYVSFISVSGTYYLNVLPKDLEHSNRIELAHPPISIASSGDYVFVQNRTDIDFFVVSNSKIEKQLTIHFDGNIAMKSDSMDNFLFTVSSGTYGKSTFHIFEVKGELSGDYGITLIMSIIIIALVAMLVWYWKKKTGKKEHMDSEEVKPKNDNERP